MRSWTDAAHPLRLIEQVKDAADRDRKAVAWYGLLVRWLDERAQSAEQMWLRCVDGRPLSAITIQFLAWCCHKLLALGKRVLALVWDNASWHRSQVVRTWIRTHNRQVKQSGQGVRSLVCSLPVKSPWLNPIEPKWLHGKRRVGEPDRTLPSQELVARVYATFDCPHEEPLSIPEDVV